LGTKATRAAIIETLYNRNYVKEQSLEATPLGIKIIKTLEKYSPVIIDEELTRNFEKEMEEILEAKKDFLKLEAKTLDEAKGSILKISEDFVKNEDKIGRELVEATEENYAREREDNTLSQCPNCKKSNLRILYNKRFKRYFIGCAGYPECKTTFSLPPNSLIKTAGKTCNKCNFPLLLAIRKAKRPWEFCFNPNCPTRKEYEERRKDKTEEVAEKENEEESS